MKLIDLDFEDKKDWIKITDLENTFNIYADNHNDYAYNLNATWYFKIPEEYLKTYTCTCNMHWPLVSYKLYGTTRLAWFLMKINNVAATDVFKQLKAGSQVKYLEKDQLQTIVEDMNEVED